MTAWRAPLPRTWPSPRKYSGTRGASRRGPARSVRWSAEFDDMYLGCQPGQFSIISCHLRLAMPSPAAEADKEEGGLSALRGLLRRCRAGGHRRPPESGRALPAPSVLGHGVLAHCVCAERLLLSRPPSISLLHIPQDIASGKKKIGFLLDNDADGARVESVEGRKTRKLDAEEDEDDGVCVPPLSAVRLTDTSFSCRAASSRSFFCVYLTLSRDGRRRGL